MNEANMPDSKPWALTTVYGYVYLVGAMTFVVVYQTSRPKTKENSGWKGLVPSPQLASGLVAILFFATRDFGNGSEKWTADSTATAFMPARKDLGIGIVGGASYLAYHYYHHRSI